MASEKLDEKLDEKAIFNIARKIKSPDARAKYLHQACGADGDLFERVNTLLGAYEEQASFLESPPAGSTSPTLDPLPLEKPGTQIGPYKLLEEIGDGGMGVVYMAEQTKPVKRRVALKLIKPGMDTRQLVARFEAERQALAIMDHPNIARVLDCGTTTAGHPYFVMELVKGVPITRYCDDNHLTPRERLELFVPICQAIQHAHQKGIIHRDIKPSNILIAEYDHKAVPKIIDFGVAKALNQQLTDKTMFTGLGQIVGSIEYMSPEQAKVNQLDVDTRGDIYSLGVLLYELLTGVTPFDRKRLLAAALDELLRIIREEEPPRPSTRLSTIDTLPSVAANRHIEPRKLSALLHGELDWIVMKALEKDRARRYETANGFANDIQRYLDDEAVQACPPSARYRFGKFARRNKVAIATGSMVAAALVIGIIGTTWQSMRASDQAARAISAEQLAGQRYENEKLARKEADSARQQEKAQRQLAEQARADAEIAKQAAIQSRDEAQTEATRANHVVKVLKSIFSSQDSRDQTAATKNYTVTQLFTDLADRLPKELSEEPAVEAEIRSIIGRALTSQWSPERAYPHFVEAQRLRETIYPPDHPIHIESLFDLFDHYGHMGSWSKRNQIANQILSRVEAIDGHVDLKLRAYAAYIGCNQNIVWREKDVYGQAVVDLAAKALEMANANNLNDHLVTLQFKRVLISHRFTELVGEADKHPDFDDQLSTIATSAEQALADCEDAFGKQHIRTVRFLLLLANIQTVQGRNAAAADLLIRAFKIRMDTGIFAEWNFREFDELRRLGLPESQIEELIDSYPTYSNYYYQCEAIKHLSNNDVAAYRSLVEKLLQRNPSWDAWGKAAFVAASLSDSATDDWAALRDLALAKIPPEDKVSWMTGGILFRSNDLQQAIEILEESDKALNAPSSFPGVESSSHVVDRWINWLFLSMSHHRLGNHQQSHEYFIRAATQIPSMQNWEYGVAVQQQTILSLLYREAFKTIEYDPDEWIVDPTDKMELVGRAELYLLNDQKQKAFLDYSAAIELEPQNRKMRLWRAEYFKSQRRFPEAIADYTKAIELDPHRIDSSDGLELARGALWLELEQYERALVDFDQAIEMAPFEFHYYKRRAEAHFHLGHFESALADLGKAVHYHPDDVSTLVWIEPKLVAQCPDASFKDGLLQLADNLIEKTQNKGDAHICRARLHFAMDHITDAEADLNKAIELDPDIASVWDQRGEMYARLGRWDNANKDFERAIQLALEAWAPRYHLALAQLAIEDTAGYRDTCQAMIDAFAETENPLDANFAAWTCVVGADAVDDWTTAIKLARLAAERQGDSLQIQNTLGTLLMRAGETDEAIQVLTELAERLADPSSSANASPAYTWYALALAYHDAGQPEQARQWRDKADAWTAQVLDDPSSANGSAVAWNRRLTLELLRNEVKNKFNTNSKSTTEKGK